MLDKTWIQSNGNLEHSLFIEYVAGDTKIRLDGYFTYEEMVQIVEHMREHMHPSDLGA